jgi:anti-sigma factor RsiW
MKACAQNRARMHCYLDSELSPAEVLEFEKHLMDCPECHAQYQELRAVSDVVRGARPLYDVPDKSLAKAQALVAADESTRKRRIIGRAAAGLVAAGACVVVVWVMTYPMASAFPKFASDTHARYVRREMPLGIVSSRPEVVSRWLSSNLGFSLQLPNYPVNGGELKRYRLVGAGILNYGGNRMAFAGYEMDGKPISLLMASTRPAPPEGGDVYRSGKLVFRFFERDGYNVITWTDHDVHYGLVSDLGARGAESCVICHGSASERRVIEELKRGR